MFHDVGNDLYNGDADATVAAMMKLKEDLVFCTIASAQSQLRSFRNTQEWAAWGIRVLVWDVVPATLKP